MRRSTTPDLEIAAIAHRQGGVVSRKQLRAIGLSPQSIDRRVRLGRLHTVHVGVYSVGHALVSPVAKRWSAVLVCGDGAVISHWSAAPAWELHAPRGAWIHVTVPDRRRIRRAGIRVHRPRALPPDEITTLDGLPITTVARTILDLAGVGLRGRALEVVLDRAELTARVDWSEVTALVSRYEGRTAARAIASTLARYAPGTATTRAAARAIASTLARYAPGTATTLSVLEDIVLELCDERGIPRPLVNHVVAGRRRDFYWPHARLVVEADGYGWHRSPSAFNDDRERDAELTLAGVRSLRFTYDQCTKRRDYVSTSTLAALRGH